MATKTEIAELLFKHLDEKLEPAIKKQMPPRALREALLVLADWVYIDRLQAVTKFTSEVVDRPRKKLSEAIEERMALAEAKERAKELAEKPSFLDALDEIS